ncbi:chromate efflux transporter [Pseudomarimonas salicorniae]|uniref:Chromate efflux transporter n=1 Tax=Pseudomarimonas salicorniae TaxID=2933270 RepID=A0ABT0GHU8_9GAMM|nr:chromate efflux transporter [Lysobacter sp. CAU 1642]MCK7594124.1 chromate efflux transporter [Lysobacter sp. CAU 1642]
MAADTRDDWKTWLRIGLLSFGGPAGQIALMHRELVEQRGWIDERGFASGLSFCMLLPGPEAQQLATYIGWRRGGPWQAVIAGSLFFLPGAMLIAAICLAYVAAQDLAPAQAALFGVQCAVISIVIEALMRVARRALNGSGSALIAILAFLAVATRALPFPLVLLAAALAGLALHRGVDTSGPGKAQADPDRIGRASLRPALIALLLWLLPLATLWLTLGDDHLLTRIALLFSELAVVTFGGAYAVLAYVTEQAVQVNGWLSTAQMMDGLGLAETTPGPLILVLQFVAFMAGAQAGESPSLWMALAASGIALWVLFLPSFVWILAGAPRVEWLAAQPRARAALQGITAAVLGVIAQVALWFALHLFFGEVDTIDWASLQLAVPDPASFRLSTVLPTLTGALLLFALHRGVVFCLGAAAGVALLQWWLSGAA